MQTLDDYFEKHGLKPEEETYAKRYEELGRFKARIRCLKQIGIALAFDCTEEKYEDYTKLLYDGGLEKTIPLLIWYLTDRDYGRTVEKDKALYLLTDQLKKDAVYSDLSIVALGELADPRAAPVLANFLYRSDRTNKHWCVRALRGIGYSGAGYYIFSYLKKERRNSRKQEVLREIRYMKDRGDNDAYEILKKYERYERFQQWKQRIFKNIKRLLRKKRKI